MDWRALVDEAIRRRKAEKLTQREHAALASVSIPTIVSFDRGEESLTLTKAFAILRVWVSSMRANERKAHKTHSSKRRSRAGVTSRRACPRIRRGVSLTAGIGLTTPWRATS